MITKRTLERYRKDALKQEKEIHSIPAIGLDTNVLLLQELSRRVLRLTQELLDIELLRQR